MNQLTRVKLTVELDVDIWIDPKEDPKDLRIADPERLLQLKVLSAHYVPIERINGCTTVTAKRLRKKK